MEYTIKFDFSTAKVGRSNNIIGSNNSGECDITTDYTLTELKTKTDDLKYIAQQSLIDNPKVEKMGSIISIDIVDIIIKK